jgi:hypothetical protein
VETPKRLIEISRVICDEHSADLDRWQREYRSLWSEARATIEDRVRNLFDEITETVKAQHLHDIGKFIGTCTPKSPLSFMLAEYEFAAWKLLREINKYLRGEDDAA